MRSIPARVSGVLIAIIVLLFGVVIIGAVIGLIFGIVYLVRPVILPSSLYVTQSRSQINTEINQENGDIFSAQLLVDLVRMNFAINSRSGRVRSRRARQLPAFVKVMNSTAKLNGSAIDLQVSFAAYYVTNCVNDTECLNERKMDLDNEFTGLDLRVDDNSGNPIFVTTTRVITQTDNSTEVTGGQIVSSIFREKEIVLSQGNQTTAVEWNEFNISATLLEFSPFPIGKDITEQQLSNQTIHDLPNGIFFLNLSAIPTYPTVAENGMLTLRPQTHHIGVCENCTSIYVNLLKMAINDRKTLVGFIQGPDSIFVMFDLKLLDEGVMPSVASVRSITYDETKSVYASRNETSRSMIEVSLNGNCPPPNCPNLEAGDIAAVQAQLENLLVQLAMTDPESTLYALTVSRFSTDLEQGTRGSLLVHFFYEIGPNQMDANDEKITNIINFLNGKQVDLAAGVTFTFDLQAEPANVVFVNPMDWDALRRINSRA